MLNELTSIDIERNSEKMEAYQRMVYKFNLDYIIHQNKESSARLEKGRNMLVK